MSGITSSLDDVLVASITNTPVPGYAPEPAPVPDVEVDDAPAPNDSRETYEIEEPAPDYGLSDDASEPEEVAAKEVDDYGNERSTKTYTEDEVNERINQAVRERLARQERNQPTQQQAQQAAASGFEYNAESNESWQQQLESFVEQTVSRMSQKQAQQAQAQREQQAQAEFETRFHAGREKFKDFADVVGNQPISDAMVLAARSMKDPAAFFYAAAKRAPSELQRIANIQDHYAQIAEIGKLEERMKQSRPATKAPRPVSRTAGDLAVQHKSDKQPSIEQMIAQDAAKRLALQKARNSR